jgi:gliding motility-associated-like protein
MADGGFLFRLYRNLSPFFTVKRITPKSKVQQNFQPFRISSVLNSFYFGMGLLVFLLLSNSIYAQTGCIKSRPKNPFPGGIDTLCQNDPSPDLNVLFTPDSVNHNLEWTTDTLHGPVLVSPPKIDSSILGPVIIYARYSKGLTGVPTCFSYWQTLTFLILSKPPKPAILPLPPAPSNRKISLCEGTSSNLSDSLVKQPGLNLHWYALDSQGNKVNFSGIITNAQYTGRDTIYYAQYGPPNSCYGDTLQVHVAVLPLPVLKVNPQKGYTICQGLAIPFNVLAQHQGYNPSYDWYVNDVLVLKKGGTGFTIPGTEFKAGDPVKVFYVLHPDFGAPYYHCDSIGPLNGGGRPFSSDTVSITILPPAKVPGPILGPYIVYQGQKNLFYSVPLDTTLSYIWRFNNQDAVINYANNTASISYSDSLNFSSNKEIVDTITVVVQNVCDSAKETLVVYIRPYLKPINILTPNGDNINDTWIINNIDNEAYAGNTVMVYDRFGTLVFKQQNYSNAGAWNGTYKGSPLSEGTYYYLIQYLEDTYTKYLKGYLTILRGR